MHLKIKFKIFYFGLGGNLEIFLSQGLLSRISLSVQDFSILLSKRSGMIMTSKDFINGRTKFKVICMNMEMKTETFFSLHWEELEMNPLRLSRLMIEQSLC